MADELALVVADDLARNEPSKPISDSLPERLRAVGGIRDVNQRKRVPQLLSAGNRHA